MARQALGSPFVRQGSLQSGRWLPKRMAYANVMATISVFIALGGTSYAAIVITGKNVKDGTLTGKDLKDRSLTASDVSRKTLGDLRGSRGPAGREGPRG